MPYTVNTNNYAVLPILPQSLGHKPVYAMPYEPFDGIYANATDAKYLSVGIAQYDQNEVSIKSMRHTGQWSPQAEELPVHRAIDMALFAAKALFDTQNGTFSLPGGVFLNQSNCISISQELQRTPTELATFDAFLTRNGQLLKDRLNALADMLADLRRRGRI